MEAIIPVRNEESTIPLIAMTLLDHPDISTVHIGIDADTTDKSGSVVTGTSALIHYTKRRGKGQVINAVLPFVRSDDVFLCDGDYTGLSSAHITQLIVSYSVRANDAICIGIPDYPAFCPTHVLNSWPWVSGIRVVPVSLIRDLELHGYLTEVQINRAAQRERLYSHFERLNGLHSPFSLSEKRLEEMERDHKWARENGIFND